MIKQLTPISFRMSVSPGDQREHGTIRIGLFIFIRGGFDAPRARTYVIVALNPRTLSANLGPESLILIIIRIMINEDIDLLTWSLTYTVVPRRSDAAVGLWMPY
jgi:hypothetical protein